jgi:hypothetical protein
MRRSPATLGRLLRVNGVGILGRRQRILTWIGFVALAAHAPLVAWVKPGDSWLLSVVVAAIVAFVIVIDDVYRRRPATTVDESVPPDPST